ncbi:MAG: AbgT family transporter [Planctomycetes bacterium]|nr:AbgT family transporter [Planctomycetota bacterium]
MPRGMRLLDWIERVGNRLPDPITLFVAGTLAVMLVSHVAWKQEWRVQRVAPQLAEAESAAEAAGDGGRIVWVPLEDAETANSLLTSEGLFWAVSTMKDNFINFPPLGVVLVGMLGIGVAEASGLIAACLKAFMQVVPRSLLTPAVVFLGIESSLAMDAGYIVLPPLAAALYKAAGRSPLAGIAAAFAGVAAGFNANLLVTGLDPMLAALTQLGAAPIDAGYRVAATCNWYFMIVSTVTMTLTGWAVTSWFVERRLAEKSVEEGGPVPASKDDLTGQQLSPTERRGLTLAAAAILLTLAAFIIAAAVPGYPLAGEGERFARWIESIVPIIFFVFLIPGIVYGAAAGTIGNDRDLAKMLVEAMSNMAPIIVLAFFAAQFIAYFDYSNLDTMLALAGGRLLAEANLSPFWLIIAFILAVAFFNLFIGSMSAKYSLLAPIAVPIMMMSGISPELTQAAYRVGDSVTNVVTPLNPYLVIVLVYLQRYVPRGGMGTLISAMVPYAAAFLIVWSLQIFVWMLLGAELGIAGPLFYRPEVLN